MRGRGGADGVDTRQRRTRTSDSSGNTHTHTHTSMQRPHYFTDEEFREEGHQELHI